MKKKTPKLMLTEVEREALRKNKIRLHEIADIDVGVLHDLLGGTLERAKELKASAEFQMIPSIGPKFSEDLMKIGFFSLDELKGNDGAELVDRMEQFYGVWLDPCVEDQCRLVVHYAEQPSSTKQWWDFTEERKQYRAKYGYPSNRPAKSWNEVE
ncbi:Pathogenicity locus [Heyndrickxia sporothermodurans]|uniref:Uncharacterized protein n=1 Tax=Heyndrickxia sporothermodurans TaxID=46224 RepID=A0A150L1B9_9BACI|nr:helix-hairpin-helix domain-containing protein [Heyndrickxia sporothermodurans]KYD05482.1 hypothetical protein B4102_3206 [Heyndrickxia sporothermodurans]PTY79431.1 Pathogenicity locus [Heyndrickxia sporothermodurans]